MNNKNLIIKYTHTAKFRIRILLATIIFIFGTARSKIKEDEN